MRSPQLPIRAGSCLLALVLLAALVPAPATAGVPAPDPAPSTDTAAGKAAALAAARRLGRPVEVTAQRTSTREVYANPDGTFTWRQHLLAPDGGMGIQAVLPNGYKNHWAVAYKSTTCASCDDTAYYDGITKIGSENPPEARVGHEKDSGGTARSYFEMNTRGLEGARIISATFNVFNTYSYSCTKTPVELGVTGGISSATTWNKQPTWKRTLATLTFSHGWSSSCPDAGEDYTGTALREEVQAVATANATNITFGLRAQLAPTNYETNTLSWKRFRVNATNPVLEVTYNHVPTVTTSSAYHGTYTGTSSDRPIACATGTDPASWPLVGAAGAALAATVADVDGGQLTVRFTVTDTAGAAVATRTTTVASGSTATTVLAVDQTAGPLRHGGGYRWTVRSEDGTDTSTPTAACGFTVDGVAPSRPTVTAVDGYPLDSATVPARTPRTLRLASTDTNLSGFCYTLQRPLSIGGPCSGTSAAAGPDGTVTITVIPPRWPENPLHVYAVDTAGNTSAYDGTPTTPLSAAPPVYVAQPDGTAAGDRPGDLDGDGHADVVATDSAGGLWRYPGTGTGGVGTGVRIGTSGWADAIIAHRGDFFGPEPGLGLDGYEDFFVRLRDNNLYLYPGNGLGGVLSGTARRTVLHPGGTNWATTTAIAAPGDLDLKLGVDLLAVEGDSLIVYTGTASGPLATDASGALKPGRVLATGWASNDVIAPGDATGDGIPDLIARRHTDDAADPDYGRLYLHPGVRAADGTYTLGARVAYGGTGWQPANRPWLASSGDVQGSVVTGSDGKPRFQPASAPQVPDLWATAPGGTAGTGVLLFCPGTPSAPGTASTVADGGFTNPITRIS
jgi:hypothetical protein